MDKYQKFYDLRDFNEDECFLTEEKILGSTSIFIYESDGEERTYVIDCLSGHFFKRVQEIRGENEKG